MEYDAIVIGAGHNGLTLAAYLQRSGLSTLVVEAAYRIGGMTRTEEPALPGFKSNPHANVLAHQAMMPANGDFKLHDRGLRTVTPAAQWGLAFSDGRPALVLYRTDHPDDTKRSVAQYSTPDAERLVELRRHLQALGTPIAQGLYQPPSEVWTKSFLGEAALVVAEVCPRTSFRDLTPKQAIDQLFESDELRTSLYQAAIEYGPGLDQPAGALAFIGITLHTLANWELPIGGMQALPDALASACRSMGATITTGTAATSIHIERGRAVGVSVEGELVRARKAIASSAGLSATLLQLLGPEHLSAATLERLREYEAVRAPVLGSVMFCLQQAPVYTVTSVNEAGINRCLRVVFGHDHAENLARDHRAVVAGGLPLPSGAVAVNSLWDPSQAPRDRHVASVNSYFPVGLDDRTADDVRSSFPEALRRRWRECAENMEPGTLLGHYFSPIERRDDRVLLTLGSDQYRTDVPGLYLCGTSTHPGGGVHGACGYNAFHAIAEDLGLRGVPGS